MMQHQECFQRKEEHWLVKRTLQIRGKVEPEILFVPISQAAVVFFFGTPAHVVEPVNAVMPQVMIAPLVNIPVRFHIAESGGYFAAQCHATVLSRALHLDLTPSQNLGICFENKKALSLCDKMPFLNPEQQRIEVLRFIEALHPAPYVKDSVDRVYDQILCGEMPLKEIVRDSGMGERSLQRHFLRRTGISLKSLSRIVRINRLWSESQHDKKFDFKRSSSADCFHDQSHLIRDFKSITGSSPQHFFSTCTTTTQTLANKSNRQIMTR